MLDERPTDALIGVLTIKRKILVLTLVKQRRKLAWVCIIPISVDRNAISKSEILNIHKYLMVKKYEIMFGFTKKDVYWNIKCLHKRTFWWIISL